MYYTIKQVKFQDNSLKMSETRSSYYVSRSTKSEAINKSKPQMTPDRKASELTSGVNSRVEGVDFRIFSPKICLIFSGRGGNFEFPRGLHHV